jgi:transposase
MDGFLGADVSKGYCDFVLLDSQKSVIERSFQLHDTAEHRKILADKIKEWLKVGFSRIFIGVESTGGYEDNWYSFFVNQSKVLPIYITRLNPKAVKGVNDATLRRTITDAVSANNIAQYLICFPEKVTYYDSETKMDSYADFRSFNKTISLELKQCTQLRNQLEKLLYQNLSELSVYCRHGIPVWYLHILKKYSSAVSIKKAGLSRLTKINGVTKEKAAAIINKLQNNEVSTSLIKEHAISKLAVKVLSCLDEIKEDKKYLVSYFSQNEDVLLLKSISGVGIETAVLAIIEIGHINKFDSVEKLVSYFGLNPSYRQSGDGKYENRISKKGRPELRAQLYMNAMSSIRCNEEMKALYAKHRAKGFCHKKAAVVVMHKLLRTMYGILKSKKPYNSDVDKKNKMAAKRKQEENQIEKKENVQKSTLDLKRFLKNSDIKMAPISKSRLNKLKKSESVPNTNESIKTGLLTDLLQT